MDAPGTSFFFDSVLGSCHFTVCQSQNGCFALCFLAFMLVVVCDCMSENRLSFQAKYSMILLGFFLFSHGPHF